MTEHRRAKCREYQRRYEQTAKGKAAKRRYSTADKGRRAARRYRTSPKGKRVMRDVNAKKVRIGDHYLGYMKTVAQARAINAYIQRRKREFIARFAGGEKAESDPLGTAPARAAAAND